MPGSHRIIARKPNAYQNRPVFEAHPELRAIEPRPVTLKAGSCTLHNHMTVHEGGANTAPRDSPNGGRRGFTMSFIPGEPPSKLLSAPSEVKSKRDRGPQPFQRAAGFNVHGRGARVARAGQHDGRGRGPLPLPAMLVAAAAALHVCWNNTKLMYLKVLDWRLRMLFSPPTGFCSSRLACVV